MTALAFFAFAAPSAGQTSALFPLDRFWSHTLEAAFAAPPAVDERRVYVALQSGQLVAIEPGRADAAWSVELAADGPPIAAGGRLYVPASGEIHALDAATGTVLWRLPAAALAVPLTYRSGWLVVALADGALQAVRADDGVVVWAQSMGAPLAARPAIDGDLLVVTLADGRIAALDLITGKPRWEPRPLGSRGGAVTVSGDRIFIGTDDGYFFSLKTRNGDLDWPPWRLGARVIGAAAADGDRVYAVALDNVVRGFSRGSGNIRWTYPLSTRPIAGPDLIDGLVVVTSGDVGAPGLIYINAATGKPAGRTPPLSKRDETERVQYPMAVSDGASPYAVIATATTSGDWQLHAYRQTFLTAIAAPIAWGKRYEVRRRLEFRTGVITWGIRVPLVPPMERVEPVEPVRRSSR